MMNAERGSEFTQHSSVIIPHFFFRRPAVHRRGIRIEPETFGVGVDFLGGLHIALQAVLLSPSHHQSNIIRIKTFRDIKCGRDITTEIGICRHTQHT